MNNNTTLSDNTNNLNFEKITKIIGSLKNIKHDRYILFIYNYFIFVWRGMQNIAQ